MNKLMIVGVIIIFVGVAYILMAAMQPVTNAIIETANTTANWTGHTDYEKAQAVLLGWRWWQWWVPGPIGVAVIVIVLRSKKAG